MCNNSNNKFVCSSLLLLFLVASLAVTMINAVDDGEYDEYPEEDAALQQQGNEGQQFPASSINFNWPAKGNDYYTVNGRLLPPLLRSRRAQWRSIGRMVHLHRPSRPLFITRSIRDTPVASDEQEQMPAPLQQQPQQPQQPLPLMFTNRQGQRWECFFAPAFSCFVVKVEAPQIMKKLAAHHH